MVTLHSVNMAMQSLSNTASEILEHLRRREAQASHINCLLVVMLGIGTCLDCGIGALMLQHKFHKVSVSFNFLIDAFQH